MAQKMGVRTPAMPLLLHRRCHRHRTAVRLLRPWAEVVLVWYSYLQALIFGLIFGLLSQNQVSTRVTSNDGVLVSCVFWSVPLFVDST
jgi:hypothetical protein